MCITGGLINLHFISSKQSCCSFPHTNGLPFLVKSHMGFNNFVVLYRTYSGNSPFLQNCLHPFTVAGGWSFCIASNLLLNSLMQTLLSFMNISLPMYCKFVLNNWHYFGDIVSPFFNNAFSKSSSFAM